MCENKDSKCDGNCECGNNEVGSGGCGDNCNCKKDSENTEHTLTSPELVEIRNEQGTVHCMLDHAGDPRGLGPYPAKGTMMLKFDEGDIPIHVCDVCAVSLLEANSEWYLFICFGCMGAKWLHERDLKQPCEGQIQGMNECPDCENVMDN